MTSAEAVATELAWRLQAILPAGLFARAVGSAIWFDVEEDGLKPSGVEWRVSGRTFECKLGSSPTSEAYLANVGHNLLSYAQDIVSESTTVAWPPVEGERSGMQDAHAEVRDGWLLLWYGNEQDTRWRCEPLPLNDWSEPAGGRVGG